MHNSKLLLATILSTITFSICVQIYAQEPYEFSVDQFSIIGEEEFVYFFDEFEDSNVEPWDIQGTVTEIGTLMTLSDPGVVSTAPLGNYLLIVWEESNAYLQNQYVGAEDGGGDLTLTSIWTYQTCIPGVNQGYYMESDIHNSDSTAQDEITIRVQNLGSELAEFFGLDQGLYVMFSKEIQEGSLYEADRQFFRVYEEDIFDDIVLTLFFDDAENSLSAAFSLDGGNIFHYPFEPFTTRVGQGFFSSWELIVTSVVVQVLSESATVDIQPDTLNLKSAGNWITCYIEIPEEYDIADVDIGTVMLTIMGATIPAELSPTNIGDHNANGIPELMVKFDRQSVQQSCFAGPAEMSVSFQTHSGVVFSGTDTVLVIDQGK